MALLQYQRTQLWLRLKLWCTKHKLVYWNYSAARSWKLPLTHHDPPPWPSTMTSLLCCWKHEEVCRWLIRLNEGFVLFRCRVIGADTSITTNKVVKDLLSFQQVLQNEITCCPLPTSHFAKRADFKDVRYFQHKQTVLSVWCWRSAWHTSLGSDIEKPLTDYRTTARDNNLCLQIHNKLSISY